jgi:hypothetical protein
MNWQAMLALVGPIVAAALPIARKYVQARITPDKLGHVTDIARMAVRAAETVATDLSALDPVEYAGALTWAEAKARFAENVIADGAAHLGLKLSPDEIDAFLHAALREMRQLADAPAPV